MLRKTPKSYLGKGVNSLMMPSAPSVTPWTMNVLPIPFHRALGPYNEHSLLLLLQIPKF